MTELASTPAPPYFAVIFASVRAPGEEESYYRTSLRMLELARQQPGFLGADSARSEDGLGITASYWATEEAIHDWRLNAEHQLAQEQGRKTWYRRFALRVCRVERAWDLDCAVDESGTIPLG